MSVTYLVVRRPTPGAVASSTIPVLVTTYDSNAFIASIGTFTSIGSTAAVGHIAPIGSNDSIDPIGLSGSSSTRDLELFDSQHTPYDIESHDSTGSTAHPRSLPSSDVDSNYHHLQCTAYRELLRATPG